MEIEPHPAEADCHVLRPAAPFVLSSNRVEEMSNG
jgi:hypothetical protein